MIDGSQKHNCKFGFDRLFSKEQWDKQAGKAREKQYYIIFLNYIV